MQVFNMRLKAVSLLYSQFSLPDYLVNWQN